MFKYSVNVFLFIVCSGLKIQDLNKLTQNGKYHYQYSNNTIYQYDDQNCILSLTCSKNSVPGKRSTLKFIKGNEVVLNETIKTNIDYVFKLNKNDNGSEIKCLDEEIRNTNNPHPYEGDQKLNDLSIIKLSYIPPVAREGEDKLDDRKDSSDAPSLETSTDTLKGKDKGKDGTDTNILYASIGLLVAFLLILIIILCIQNLRKKKKREDKIHLQITDSQIISQNTEPVTFNDTYANPSDDNSYEDASLNLAIPQTYCTPYIGNGDVYAEPIPKNLRTVKKTVNYVNTFNLGSKTERRKKSTNIRYVNHTLPKQNVQVEEYVAPSDVTYQDMYSEVNS